MVNLKAVPYFLNDEQIVWVENTILSMSIEEKIGQLFISMTVNRDPKHIEMLCSKYHIGGVRWQGGTLEEIYEQNRLFQMMSKVPVLVAANCEAGGNGAVKEGTLVATHAACGACETTDTAYEMGRVSGIEAAAVGCNWTFSPVSDMLFNWRNTIVNTRSFGKDPATVVAMCKAYMAGVAESGLACCTKHFPGDGVEERDQHILKGCNDMSCDEWDQTFGQVYRELFAAGIESVMTGHICLPSYSRKLRLGIQDDEIMPATLAPEILTDLLRDQLGFNGLVVTDASHMVGLSSAAPRSRQVPGAIAAGCDMFLFFRDPDEDFQYMLDGYHDGTISEQRLSDALHRIIGLKAKLGLNKQQFPDKANLSKVGCDEHLEVAARAANASITLVKDTQKLLPIDPAKRKRVKLYFIESAPVSYLDGSDPARQIVVEELRRVGFEVTVHTNYYDLEAAAPHPANRHRTSQIEPAEVFKASYDLVLMFFNMKGYGQENNMRIRWSASHSSELPWFVHEVPTIGVSLNFTNHLIDLPMLKTFINAYAPTREYIRACIEKIVGRSDFKGHFDENVWCGRWDTRL